MPPQGGQSTSEASHKAQNEYHDARFSLLAPIKPTLSKPSRVARRQYVASSQAEGPDRVTTSRMTVFSDALAIMIPLLFILLAILAASLHGKRVSTAGDGIQQVLLLSPTIFPIVFAAIVGRCMRSVATYCSQHGNDLQFLEQLTGSQSLFATFQHLICLRYISLVGVLIAALWTLSPVGGQAFLRLVTTTPMTEASTVRYIAPAGFYEPRLNVSDAAGDRFELFEPGIYTAAMLSPGELAISPRDLWGTPKIPSKVILSANASDGGWFKVANDTSSGLWQSKFGITVDADTLGDNTTFQLLSGTIDIQNCSLRNTTIGWFLDAFRDIKHPQNSSQDEAPLGLWDAPGNRPVYPSSFLRTTTESWQDFMTARSKILKVLYGVRLDALEEEPRVLNTSQIPICFAECALIPVIVEAEVNCTGDTCAVAAIRPTDDAFSATAVRNALNNVFTYGSWAVVGSANKLGAPSMVDLSLSYAIHLGTPKWFTAAFNEAFNTMLQVQSLALTALIRGHGRLADFDHPEYIVDAPALRTGGLSYVCHRSWLAIGIIMAIVLEVAAILTAVLRRLTVVPDLFGYVSSIALHDPHCEAAGILPSSALNGLERSRKLGKVRFQVVDVRPNANLGKIRFIAQSPQYEASGKAQVPVGKVVRQRLYY